MEVTTEHQKWRKISTNSVISSFDSAECRSPQQELEVSPRSGLYLLVFLKESMAMNLKSQTIN